MIHKFFKKTLICLMVVLLLLTSSIDIFGSSKAHANLVSKPITIAAKKAAKDVVKNTAVEMINQIFSEFLVRELIEGVKIDDGYSPVCMDSKKDSIQDCPPDKRAQIKTKLSSTDKSKLEKTVESVLEKKTNTSSKWGKFLDIFIPLFLVSGAKEFISASLDGDILSFFDEVAQEALTESDLLKPLFVPPPTGSLEQLDFSKHVESVDVNIFFDDGYLYLMHYEFAIVLKPNITLGFSLVDKKGNLIENSSSTTLTISPYFKTWVETISGEKPYLLPEAHGVTSLFNGDLIGLTLPPVLWRSANRYYVVDNDYQTPQGPATSEAKRYLIDYWSPMLKDPSVNARMNTLLAMMATNPSANFKFDSSVNVKLPPPVPDIDYGKQTATDKIKDANGNVPLKGMQSFTFTYGDTHIYPSDQSTTGWKDKTTGRDITVVEDDVSVKDKDEKEPEPEKPTEPSNPSCNESDDMEVDSGQCEGVPYFGSKLEFIFGNATGNKNHIERSLAMELQLNSIGIFDDAKGKKLVLDNLSNAFDNPSSIRETKDNGRLVRVSVLTGPNGDLKVESVWDKEKLISVKLGEDVEEEPEDGTGETGWSMPKGGAVIDGRKYSEHALERMAPDTPEVRAELTTRAQAKATEKGLEPGTKEYYDFVSKYVDPRGITPTVVEDVIKNTSIKPGRYEGTFMHQNEKVTVIINSNGDVITVIPR